MILTFAKTEAEFLMGTKTVTRRFYKPRQTARWQAQWDKGKLLHQAYDKSPRQGGKQIGWFRLTERPYLEALRDMPESELEAEGGMVDSLEAFQALVGKGPSAKATVIRFEKVSGFVFGAACIQNNNGTIEFVEKGSGDTPDAEYEG